MDKIGIKAVIVDDDQTSRLIISQLVDNINPGIRIIGSAGNVAEAVALIDSVEPDLVFLDIMLTDGEGFDVLEQVTYHGFEVIFTTSLDNQAVRAFDVHAIHYLVKPIRQKDLEKALTRFNALSGKASDCTDKILEARRILPSRILVPDAEAIHIVKSDQILYLEASDTYTMFYLLGGKKLLASRPLASFEKLLYDQHFSRIHSKYLVNLGYCVQYIRGKGGSVKMEGGVELEVSVRKKSDFMLDLHNYARSIG